ncbi:NAD-dependent epimerase/dehydratase family protein [Actinoallomurus sp. NPDC052274]|uniref:NAD-dependent epimerase/dehydratase family protein n=1 Tax=Actinoallomurus sp. NPDC052274 TaxID=3155420 RepID=UPI003423AD6A
MRILVTGGAGFIGSRVVTALRDEGHEVRVFDALIPGVHRNPPRIPEGVDFVHADLRDAAALDDALDGIDLVSHQAAMVGRGREILDAPLYVGCNDLGTAMLLHAMTRAGIDRMVLASSVVIYGDSRYRCAEHGRVRSPRRSVADLEEGRYEPRCPGCGAEVAAEAVTEEDLLDPPHNVYAVTKLAQENLVAAWARETRGRAVALRYHNVYGPEMPFDSPYSGVASTFRSDLAAGRSPHVYEDGGSRRDFVHVADIASANVAALRRDEPGLRTYNVASGTPRTILDLAEALTSAAGGPAPVVTGEYRVGDVRHIFASPERLIRELGWRPAVGFAEGMREFATAPMRDLIPSAPDPT